MISMTNIHLLICVAWSTLAVCQLPAPSMSSVHSHTYASMQRVQRKQSPIDHNHKRTQFSFQSARMSPARKKHGVPSYAVQMEPLVQYSQPDPLYSIEKQFLTDAKPLDVASNDINKNSYIGPMVAEITEAETISRAGHIMHARLRPPMQLHPPKAPRPPRGRPAPPPHLKPPQEFATYGTYWDGPPEVPEPPEPIIEIIIRESNESLPAPPPLPTPPPPKKVKEPVQVFYVKYSKDPAGYGYGGEERVIYDPPVPAVTPPENNNDPEEENPEPEPVIEPEPEEVTSAPLPSTTLKAIIRPDSETFHSESGVRISFGQGHDEEDGGGLPPSGGDAVGPSGPGPSGGGPYPGPASGPESPYGHESAPQPSVVLPGHQSNKPFISRSSSEGEVSTITKRNPAPFNQQHQQFSHFGQPPAPSTFQQLPQFPAQDFQPPSLNPNQYSTIPQNYQLQRQQPNVQQPQRYTTINNPPPVPQQYHTINQPGPSPSPPPFQAFQSSPQPHHHLRTPSRTNSEEQHQQQVEQINRLQLQQQQLQQQLAQHHRFQQPQLASPQLAQQAPITTQFSQQPSQQIFPHQPPQQSFFQQQQQQQHSQRQQQPIAHQHQVHHQQQQSNQHQNQQQIHTEQQRQQFHQQSQPQNTQQKSNFGHFHNNHRVESHSTFIPTARPLTPTPSPAQQYFRTTSPSTTTEEVTEIVTEDPKKVEKEKKIKDEKQKKNIANLPDEVPDDLRQQLLSSGILSNADIEILDYDKIGDIPLESLPPEALANFQQAAGSERVETVRRPNDSAEDRGDSDSVGSASEARGVATINTENGEMEMKVVRFNPEKDKGVPEQYMKKGAKHVAPVVLNDNKYNRYLPLQVSGAQFPVPDIPELRGRNVSSVVVLAPVNYEFLNRRDEDSRTGRSAAPVLEVQGVHFIAGDVLKTLVHTPTADNYRRWLDAENSTSVDKQSVVLLVVGPGPSHPSKEIFMYDIPSGRVSKLRGELSATFVQVAESNSNNRDLEEISDLSSSDQLQRSSQSVSKPTR